MSMGKLFDLMVSHFFCENVFGSNNSFSQIKLVLMTHDLEAKILRKCFINHYCVCDLVVRKGDSAHMSIKKEKSKIATILR